MVEKNKFFIKFVSILLSVLMVYIPTIAYAGQSDPDDSLATNGKLMVMGKGQTAPWAGILFDIRAATKLKLDAEFAQKKFELELRYQKSILTSEFQLKLGLLQAKHDALRDRTDSLLKIKTLEIDRLQELVKKNPNSYSHWWFIGGIVAGCLLSIGVYYAAVQINK